jgi:outer membrane protein assembly factor BamB
MKPMEKIVSAGLKGIAREGISRRGWPFIRVGLVALVLLAIVLAGAGCVRGQQPVGWSGGVVSDNTLLVGSREGRLVTINLADTSRRWSEPLKATRTSGSFGCSSGSSAVPIYGTPVVSDNLVYISGYNGKFYAFASDSLATRWVYPRDNYLQPIVGGAAVAGGKVYFGDSDGKVYALDAATGDRQWEYATGDKVWGTPTISGDTLYIGSFDKKLYALNTADGSPKWSFPTGGAIISTPLVADGTVYFGSFDRNLYAVSAASGQLKWKFPGRNWFWADPVIYGDTIYAGCLDGKVYALNADTGVKVAEPFDLKSPVSSSPVVVDSSVIFATKKGVVFAIDAESRQMKQLADVGKEVYGPLCASDGIVYLHTQDLTMHRLNVITGAILENISLGSTG